MYNPKDILTDAGYEEYLAHLFNIKSGIFFILCHADDLHLDDNNILNILYKIEEILDSNILKTGDGEVYDRY